MMDLDLPVDGKAAPVRASQAAAPFLFFLLGMVFATWAARIPSIRDALQLNAADLGLVLLCGGIGSVLSFPMASFLIAHFGARRAALQSGAALLAILALQAWMPNRICLMAGMTFMGMSACSFDVAINAIAAELEKSGGRSMMSLLHAWFCVGTFGGALLGSLLASAKLDVHWHFALVAAAQALPLWLAFNALPSDAPDPTLGKRRFALPHGPLVMLGIIAFCGSIAEGSIGSWSGVFLVDRLHVGDGVAPLGYAAFAAAMLAVRLVGDRLKERFGARAVVAAGSLLAALGTYGVVAAPNVALAVAGFALTGAGVATVFPFVFSAAGRYGASPLAGVATMGYSGSLIGPPVIGFVAHRFGLAAGMVLVGTLNLAVAAAASKAKALD
ncbi:MAG TPA: MFS transporter [Burkholderiaceae bacterium]